MDTGRGDAQMMDLSEPCFFFLDTTFLRGHQSGLLCSPWVLSQPFLNVRFSVLPKYTLTCDRNRFADLLLVGQPAPPTMAQWVELVFQNASVLYWYWYCMCGRGPQMSFRPRKLAAVPSTQAVCFTS